MVDRSAMPIEQRPCPACQRIIVVRKDHEFECDAELRQLRAEQQGDRHAISILDIDNERLRALADGRLQLLRAERKGYEAEIKRLRELVRELRQFIPYEKPEQGPLPAWIVDIAERAEKASDNA